MHHIQRAVQVYDYFISLQTQLLKRWRLVKSVVSALLWISIASRALMVQNVCLAHLSVRKSELWQNSWLDPDAVWGGERGRSSDGCIRLGWWSSKGRRSFGGEFGAFHCNQWGLCDALFSNYFEDLLRCDTATTAHTHVEWLQQRYVLEKRFVHFAFVERASQHYPPKRFPVLWRK